VPFEKCRRVLVAHELTAPRLLPAFPDSRSRCFIEGRRLGMFRCDRKKHFSGFILIASGNSRTCSIVSSSIFVV